MKTKTLVLCAVFAAVICVFSVITVPTGIVPVTLGYFGIMLTAVIIGAKRGVISVIVFILLGAVGLPVFSGFRGGAQMLFGPTGGYIWGYIPMAAVIGMLAARLPAKKLPAVLKLFCGCILGMLVCYALGTAQFMIIQRVNTAKALAACVVPFVPFDIVKAAVAAWLGHTVRVSLVRAGVIAW